MARTIFFQLKHVDKSKTEMVGMCMRALNDALGYPAFSFRERSRHTITFSNRAMRYEDPPDMGYCVQDDQGRWRIAVRPSLSPKEAAGVLLHELGHVLHLDHTHRQGHIMASCPPKASFRLYGKYAHQIASLVAKK